MVALALDNAGSGLFLPLTIVFLHRVGGLAVDEAGFAVALGTLLGLAAPPLAGRIVDRVGPRRVVVISLLLQAAGILGYLVARDWRLVAVGAALVAVGTQAFYSSLFALIADVHDGGPMDHAFARFGQVRSAAFGAGAVVAAGLLSLSGGTGLRVAAAVDAATFLLAGGVLAVAVHPRSQHGRAATSSRKERAGRRPHTVSADRPYLALIVLSSCVALSGDVFLVGLPIYALEDLNTPSWLPGACLALLTAITALGGTAAVRATARYRRSSVIAAGAGLSVAWALIALLALTVSRPAAVGLLVAGTAVEAAAALLYGRMNALAEATTRPEHRGRYLAAFQLAFTVAALIAPAVVGLSVHGAGLPWMVVALFSATAAVAYPSLGRILSERDTTTTPVH
jgi:MFS family permease